MVVPVSYKIQWFCLVLMALLCSFYLGCQAKSRIKTIMYCIFCTKIFAKIRQERSQAKLTKLEH